MDGENEQAVSLMKEAVNMEESTSKHPVTPGELIPAKELLGDMLMQLGKTEEALVTYEQNLATHPNRFNGLFGAAMAAKEEGDFEKSTYYFKQLLLNTQESNSTRPELITAQNFLDTQKG
jgi:tetratricopeptide (TPR) repeat protein